MGYSNYGGREDDDGHFPEAVISRKYLELVVEDLFLWLL